MVSKPLAERLGRLRSQFGVEVEILDASLATIYPQTKTELRRAVDESGALRNSLAESLATGRTECIRMKATKYTVAPLHLRSEARDERALVVVSDVAAAPPQADVVPYLVCEMLDAEGRGVDALRERDRSRRLLATLRFLRHIVETEGDAELAHALLQAITVWFDVDARIYERDLTDGYTLCASLPGSQLEETAQRLNADCLGGSLEPRQVDGRTVLIPIGTGRAPEWVLAVVGMLSGDAAIQLPVLGRLIGAQLELSRARQRQALQQRFAEIFQANLAPDMIATRALEELVEISGAGSASLIVTRAGRARALATIGSPPPLAGVSEPDAWIFAADGIVCPFPIEKEMSAAVHLWPLAGQAFTATSARAARVGVEVLRTWACGAGLSLDDAETTCGQITADELKRGQCRTRGVLAGVPDCRSLAVAGYAGR